MLTRDLDYFLDLKRVSFDKCECYIHEDHRLDLPLIHLAQQERKLSKPCTMVFLNTHDDTFEPGCIDEATKMREEGIGLEELVFFCQDRLSDHDWIKAGMELGLISDVVIFGMDTISLSDRHRRYIDIQGNIHRIEMAGYLGNELILGENMVEGFETSRYFDLWDILQCQPVSKKGLSFLGSPGHIFLDIDLDYFDIVWKNYQVPWPDELFVKEFLSTSEYIWNQGWTGKMFLNQLIDHAGALTIVRNSEDEEMTENIMRKVNHYLFDNRLFF